MSDRMKTTRTIVVAHIGVKRRLCAGQYLALSGGPRRLQRALAQTRALERSLAASRQEAMTARQQLARLAETNARLKELALHYQQEVARARHFALHDELTRLPNRTLLLDRMTQVLARSKRCDKQFALLFLDLDGFKDINDRLGHVTGDKVLQRVAERLLSCVRGGDTACRYGGDEFVLLLPEVETERRAMEVAEKIRGHLAKPYEIDGHSIALTATVGIAVYPNNGVGQVDLIEYADATMYRAKSANGNSGTRLTLAASR
jgi:diguanylate cyclase